MILVRRKDDTKAFLTAATSAGQAELGLSPTSQQQLLWPPRTSQSASLEARGHQVEQRTSPRVSNVTVHPVFKSIIGNYRQSSFFPGSCCIGESVLATLDVPRSMVLISPATRKLPSQQQDLSGWGHKVGHVHVPQEPSSPDRVLMGTSTLGSVLQLAGNNSNRYLVCL